MKAEIIRSALIRQPFEPFSLTMTSGARHAITNPLYAAVSAERETVQIWRDSDREHLDSIHDIGHVKSLEYTASNGDAA